MIKKKLLPRVDILQAERGHQVLDYQYRQLTATPACVGLFHTTAYQFVSNAAYSHLTGLAVLVLWVRPSQPRTTARRDTTEKSSVDGRVCAGGERVIQCVCARACPCGHVCIPRESGFRMGFYVENGSVLPKISAL